MLVLRRGINKKEILGGKVLILPAMSSCSGFLSPTPSVENEILKNILIMELNNLRPKEKNKKKHFR